MSETTKTGKPAALVVGKFALVSVSVGTLLYTGPEITLDAMRPFVGRAIEVYSGQAHGIKVVTLESVTRNRETGDVVFWGAESNWLGAHLCPVVRRR